MRTPGLPSIVLTLLLVSPCHAGTQNISAQLREQAVQLCSGDAMRLCLASLMDEDETTQCMAANRSRLSVPCRAVMDEGSHAKKH